MIDWQKWRFVKANVVPAFKRLLFDRPGPMFVEFFVTRRCNLNCSYCFNRDEKANDPLTLDLKRRIDKLKELGCNVISFMGGEPTLRKDLIDLIKYSKHKKMFISIDTNGTLLNKDYIDRLAEAGLNSIVVSLDGIRRIKESRKTVQDNPELLNLLEYAYREKGIRVFANLVLTNKNIEEVLPLLELIKDRGIVFTVCLVHKSPCKRWHYSKYNIYRKKDIQRFDKLFSELVKRKKMGYPMFEPLWYYHNLNKFVRGKFNWQCRAGRHLFAVDVDGRFMICSDSKPMNINLVDMGNDYWSKHKKIFEKQIEKCVKSCPENHVISGWWYNEHKLRFMFNRF